MYSFIWDDKPHKVSKCQLTNDYEQGGLKMINLDYYILSQKFSWIKRLFTCTEAPWVKLSSKIVNFDKLCAFGPMWSESLAKKISNPFWKDVILAWNTLTCNISLENSDKLSCPLWYNPKISTVPLYLPHWYCAGIRTPSDLINADGNIFSLSETSKLFKIKINFLDYLRVERCLLRYLKDVDTLHLANMRPIFPVYLKILYNPSKGSKQFYQILNIQYENNSLRKKWSLTLETDISKIQWQKIYRLCFKNIKSNDFVWLQYRIIQRILGTRSYLYKTNIIDNSICIYCNSAPETIDH